MTTADAIRRFDILIDKFGSPYFTEQEKLDFLNMAQLELVNRLIPDSLGGVVNFEMDNNTEAILRPLIIKFNKLVQGTLTNTDIGDAMVSLGFPFSAGFRLIALAANGTPIKFVRHNSLNSFVNNTFKAPSTSKPVYSQNSGGYEITPNAQYQCGVTVLKLPTVLTAVNSPDFDDYAMNQVITIAVDLAIQGIRDTEAAQIAQATKVAK